MVQRPLVVIGVFDLASRVLVVAMICEHEGLISTQKPALSSVFKLEFEQGPHEVGSICPRKRICRCRVGEIRNIAVSLKPKAERVDWSL